MKRWKIVTMLVILLAAGVLLVIALFILSPHNIPNLASNPAAVRDYGEAVSRADSFREQGKERMNPLCQLQLMAHGYKTEQIVILVHGYTSCPQQFHKLGKRFHASGSNVLIAPLPNHGLLDRMTADHAQLKAEELASYADEVVDIAKGLGERIIMMGISAGGVTTAWAAQHRADIDLAVIISPAFGFKKVPTFLTAAVMNFASVLPDAFTWWNPDLQGDAPPSYTYPRYSRRALAQILRLGFAVRQDMKRNPPAAKKIVMVLNPNDDQINNELTRALVKRWQSSNANISTYEFDASLGLGHDLIDPNLPDQKVDSVYPKLIELAGGREMTQSTSFGLDEVDSIATTYAR